MSSSSAETHIVLSLATMSEKHFLTPKVDCLSHKVLISTGWRGRNRSLNQSTFPQDNCQKKIWNFLREKIT